MVKSPNLALLIGGQLGIKILTFLHNKYKISCLFTDGKSDEIIKFAKANLISIFVGNPRGGKTFDFIKKKKVDLLLSVNYLFLIEKDLITWPKKYAINVHGSLLPKYRGRTPHVWAIINNEKYTGITAHLINEGCDAGNIIKQIKVPIRQTDTGNDLLLKYLKLYPEFIDEVLKQVSKNQIKTFPQDSSKATYFGKRSPEDGKIDWNWQKERIFNWVRALAKPYPGAFSHYDDNRIIFHKLNYSDLGFSWDQENGLILKAQFDKLFVKTANGVVTLSKIENPNHIKFKTGIILK